MHIHICFFVVFKNPLTNVKIVSSIPIKQATARFALGQFPHPCFTLYILSFCYNVNSTDIFLPSNICSNVTFSEHIPTCHHIYITSHIMHSISTNIFFIWSLSPHLHACPPPPKYILWRQIVFFSLMHLLPLEQCQAYQQVLNKSTFTLGK